MFYVMLFCVEKNLFLIKWESWSLSYSTSKPKKVKLRLIICIKEMYICVIAVFWFLHMYRIIFNPAGTPGYWNGTEIFFGLKGRLSVVQDV